MSFTRDGHGVNKFIAKSAAAGSLHPEMEESHVECCIMSDKQAVLGKVSQHLKSQVLADTPGQFFLFNTCDLRNL
jgi:hypothetical protein